MRHHSLSIAFLCWQEVKGMYPGLPNKPNGSAGATCDRGGDMIAVVSYDPRSKIGTFLARVSSLQTHRRIDYIAHTYLIQLRKAPPPHHQYDRYADRFPQAYRP
ncbi:hypothetical protein Tco_0921835 [Tanacetum coccineum]